MERIEFARGKQRDMLLEYMSIANKSQREAAKAIGIPRRTLRNWIQEKRTLPADIYQRLLRLSPKLRKYAEHVRGTLDADWGRKKGGQKCYKVISKKYGKEELARRRFEGGKKSIKLRLAHIESRLPGGEDAQVLELLGALIGDGWIGISGGRKQVCYCGNINQEAYARHLQTLLFRTFHIHGHFKLRRKNSVFYIIINSGPVYDFFRNKFDFPTGLKTKFNVKLFPSDWKGSANVIRGIFDTDGGIYFDRAKAYARPYPVIDITSHNPELLGWLSRTLAEKGFKVIRLKYSIRLKTVEQVERWFNEVKPSNGMHTQKWKRWKSRYLGP